MKFCRYCSAQLNDDAIFCDKCGSRLVAESNDKTSFEGGETVFDGKALKCPYCLNPIPSNAIKCPYCNNEIRGRESTSSVKAFFNEIKNENKYSKKVHLIKSFPVPNNKEDIVEFMLLASANFDSDEYLNDEHKKSINAAWLSKIELCYQKAQMLLQYQPELKQIEKTYNDICKKISDSKKSVFRRRWLPLIISGGATITLGLAIAIPLIADEFYVPKPKEGQTIFVECSHYDFEGDNYKDVQAYFVNKGFENVTLNPLKDLITGWINKKNTVDTVSISGNTSFHKKRWHYPTEPIIISYHSF